MKAGNEIPGRHGHQGGLGRINLTLLLELP